MLYYIITIHKYSIPYNDRIDTNPVQVIKNSDQESPENTQRHTFGQFLDILR